MSDLIRWEPIRELRSLHEAMDRLFDDAFVGPGTLLAGGIGSVALDMYQTDDEVIVKVAIPGIKAEDLDINITGDTLTIRGEARHEEEVREENYLRRERRYGQFTRSVQIPVPVVTDGAEATVEDGILELRIPKAEEVKPKLIEVKPKGKNGRK